MATVNLREAETNLSRLIEALVSGQETEVTIARDGVPAVTMRAAPRQRKASVFGRAKGRFTLPSDWDAHGEEIAELFNQPPDW